MHWSVVVTVCLCLSVSSFAVKVPGKDSVQDETSLSNEETTSSIVPVVEPIDVPTTKTGSRILFLAPIVMYSHTLDYLGVAETLASNGHEITMVSAMKFNKPYLHREVLLSIRDINTMLPNLWAGRAAGFSMINEWVPMCMEVLSTTEIQNIKKEQFDFIVMSAVLTDCILSVVHEMQIPFAFVIPVGLSGVHLYGLAGNPIFLSFTPSLLMGVTSTLDGVSFTNRFLGVLTELLMDTMYKYIIAGMDREVRAQGFGSPDMPHLLDIYHNSSLFIVNSIRTMDPVGQPVVQSVVYAGGIHLKDAEPLTGELEEWAQNSGEAGFIYMSFGSIVKPSEMPEEWRQVFIKAFSSIDQKVLWKFDQETMADLPDNVVLRKWLPQQDILG
ncbi:unnamed protein product, partial [Meganyctiphanes norvegica]